MASSIVDVNGLKRQAIGFPERIKVLMYHRVFADEELSAGARRYAVHVSVLENHLRTLERMGCTAVTFHDIALYRRGELNLPRRPVVISFDDGYEDTYRLAFPLMKEYGMRGVVFALGDRSIRSNVWDSGNGITPASLMSEDQILELHDAGFEIGSHSLTHRRLTELTRDEAWEEISRSRILLEMTLNDTVRSFSYPYGLLNDQLRLLVREAGYEFACGVYSGPYVFGLDDWDIRRIEPSNRDDSLRFRLHMGAPYQKIGALRYRLKRFLERPEHGPTAPSAGERKGL